MPARRRVAGLESDDTFTIVVDDSSAPVYGPEVKNHTTPPANSWTGHFQQTGQQLFQTFTSKVAQVSSSTTAFINPTAKNSFIAPPTGAYQPPLPPQSSVPINQPTEYQQKPRFEEPDSDPEPEIEFIMTARDRSGEFGNAIRSLQSRNIQRAVNIRDPKRVKQMQSYAEFMMIAKTVGKNIASTYAKLEKLTLLAKKKSLFDDRPTEIQELTYIIKGDLNSLNQQIARLQEVSKSQRKQTSGKHLLSHSSNMVVALQAKLANMSTDFKQILEVRTENLKQQKTRRDQFSQGGIASAPPTRAGNSHQPSLLMESEYDEGQTAENAPLIPRSQQMMMYDENDSYLQQRAETMQNIESTIVELGGIFQQLAHMVKEQEEMVERIDTNILDVGLNVDMAHNEILKYFRTVSRNRSLMIKIFGVLIFFFIFFIIFMR
ncbi:syntaxin-5 [Culicoides brevitarsis]|uniref:syntaxin-5 n=1 Tax=Culicoides brevitarsis TaxID=469753 RepID=UPI00307BB299